MFYRVLCLLFVLHKRKNNYCMLHCCYFPIYLLPISSHRANSISPESRENIIEFLWVMGVMCHLQGQVYFHNMALMDQCQGKLSLIINLSETLPSSWIEVLVYTIHQGSRVYTLRILRIEGDSIYFSLEILDMASFEFKKRWNKKCYYYWKNCRQVWK